MPLITVLWLQCPLPSPDRAVIPAPITAKAPSSVLQPAMVTALQPSPPSEFAQSLFSCLRNMEQSANLPETSSEFASYPEQIAASSQPGAVTYKRKSGYHAVRLADPEAEVAEAVTTIRDGKGAIALFEGPHPVSLKREVEKPLPVYGDEGIAVVPTGEIFIRFQDGVDARDRVADLEAAGYAITKILDFAPQAAWIHATSGEPADSFQRLTRLQGLSGVEKIEPQLLMERQLR